MDKILTAWKGEQVPPYRLVNGKRKLVRVEELLAPEFTMEEVEKIIEDAITDR